MRFLLVSTDYADFLTWLYAQNPGLETSSYAAQVRTRAESLFGLADFYSRNLRKLGHDAWDIDANNEFMQKAWESSHRPAASGRQWEFRLRRGFVPWLSRKPRDWFYDILRAQIAFYKPDVLFNHWIDIDSAFLRDVKPKVRLVVGGHASPLHGERDLGVYDLMFSAADNFVDYFRRHGLRSERLRFGFEPEVLAGFNGSKRSIPVSFVGNLFRIHASRLRWLDHVCENAPVQVWAPSVSELPGSSPAVRAHRGAAWGRAMYDVLHRSRITLNHHIDATGDSAANLRLFEATGMGALLVTDWKKNLHEIFTPGKEVVAYRSDQECAELVRYYLEHDDEREAIARAGQQRTLREHTFGARMQELVDIVRRYL